MLGRLVLILIQFAAGWYLGPLATTKIALPKLGSLDILLFAVVIAIIVWLVGVIGALVLKDVAQPSASTLTVTLICALIGAGLTMIPEVMGPINRAVRIPTQAFPLIGAVLGYAVRR